MFIFFNLSCTSDEGDENSISRPNFVVIFTDDQGYADLGVQRQVKDIRTPHIDSLAVGGIRFSDGYVTAPVCSPSRIGLITGRYQQRFGVDNNTNARLPENVLTLPQRLKKIGYTTGMVGKSHFGRGINTMGFDDYFENPDIWKPVYRTTHNLEGKLLPLPAIINLRDFGKYRIDAETDAALQFIERHSGHPFFLYVAYTAPHVPLEAPAKYLNRFHSVQDKKRRFCLAMMSAVDDGVGKIVKSLRKHHLEQNTIIFFISDNGAPLSMEIARDGSLNTPLSGEKDLLLEGGIRIPWIMRWKGCLHEGALIRFPVISLDVAATVLSAAGANNMTELDGIDLLPYLLGKNKSHPQRQLFWYTRAQQAVRENNWKLFRTTDKPFNLLVNLKNDISEKENLASQYPNVVKRLTASLDLWQKQTAVKPARKMHPDLQKRLKKSIRSILYENNYINTKK